MIKKAIKKSLVCLFFILTIGFFAIGRPLGCRANGAADNVKILSRWLESHFSSCIRNEPEGLKKCEITISLPVGASNVHCQAMWGKRKTNVVVRSIGDKYVLSAEGTPVSEAYLFVWYVAGEPHSIVNVMIHVTAFSATLR